jgi:hypothetical protein
VKIPPPLPYRWYPLGTRNETRPSVGQIIAWRHAAWRVIESGPVPEVDWSDNDRKRLTHLRPEFVSRNIPWTIIVRPVRITADDPRSRDHDVHLGLPARSFTGIDAYPNEHYPVCSICGEPLPCREEMAREEAEKETRRADRYSMPGVCPACEEPVTARQKTVNFEENLRVPAGPPVTFHRRGQCVGSAVRYEQEWAAADPDRRTTRLSCSGHIHHHLDGPECSQDPVCPGAKVPHRSAAWCHARSGACARCKDAIAAKNAAEDWTVWADRPALSDEGGDDGDGAT